MWVKTFILVQLFFKVQRQSTYLVSKKQKCGNRRASVKPFRIVRGFAQRVVALRIHKPGNEMIETRIVLHSVRPLKKHYLTLLVKIVLRSLPLL